MPRTRPASFRLAASPRWAGAIAASALSASLLTACATDPALQSGHLEGKTDGFPDARDRGLLVFDHAYDVTSYSADRAYAWEFTLDGEASIAIRTAGDEIDTDLFLFRRDVGSSEWGMYLERNDDFGGKLTSQIDLPAATPGEYRVVVMSSYYQEEGSFVLSAECAGTCPPPPARITCQLTRLPGIEGDADATRASASILMLEDEVANSDSSVSAKDEEFGFGMEVWDGSLGIVFNDSNDEVGSMDCEVPTDLRPHQVFCEEPIEAGFYDDKDDYYDLHVMNFSCQVDATMPQFRQEFGAAAEGAFLLSEADYQPEFLARAFTSEVPRAVDGETILALLGDDVAAFYAEEHGGLVPADMAWQLLDEAETAEFAANLISYQDDDDEIIIAAGEAWERLFDLSELYLEGARAIKIGTMDPSTNELSEDDGLYVWLVVGVTDDGYLAGFLVGTVET